MAPDPSPYRFRLLGAVLAVFCMLVLLACAGLPPLQPPGGETGIELPFPQGRWQLIHRIEARFPGKHKALMMGALELDSVTGHLTCALMTVEGFTLFSASETDHLEVTRAVPPFDGPGFAQGLMADLRLLFFPPSDTPMQTGSLDGRPVQRFLYPDGHTTDVIAHAAGRFRIDHYGADARPIRRAMLRMRPSSAVGQGLAGEILLEALDDAGYTLRLDLIDAVPMETREKNDAIGPDPKDAP